MREAMSDDVTDALEAISYRMVSRPWSGRTGARDFRILATLVRRIHFTGARSLVERTDLRSIADEAGLSWSNSIHEALDALAADGWLTWTPGIGDVRAEYRKQSVIELKPTDTLGRYLVKDLPWPKLSLYDSGNGGNHAYLVIPLVLASVVNTGVSTYSTADLC